MSNKERITILGGGNGGFAAAADLTIRGHEVILCEHPDFAHILEPVRAKGGIDLETLPSNGLSDGFAKLYGITSDIEYALSNSEIVMVIAPSFALKAMAELCAPYVKDNQVFVLCPGNIGGSIIFKNSLKAAGCNKAIWIAEFECMMYACRKKDETSVWIRGYKRNLGCGIFPRTNSKPILERLQALYPNLIDRGNVLEVAMCNPNMVAHVPTMLFSASNIDQKEDRLFYVQCMSESVGRVMDQLNEERMQINQLPGFKIPSLRDVVYHWYHYQGADGKTMRDIQSSNPIFKWSKMPTDLNHRYITEDIPYGLIPMQKILEMFGFSARNMEALSIMACALTGKNFYAEAITPEVIGIAGMTASQLLQYLETGNK